MSSSPETLPEATASEVDEVLGDPVSESPRDLSVLDDDRPLGERYLDEERSPVFETRVAKATELWESGKSKFSTDVMAALADFELGLFHVDFDELSYNFELMDKHRDQIDKVRQPLRLNAAACLLKLNKPKRTIKYCDQVLEQEKSHVKALYRRAKAHEMMGNPESALEDLEKAHTAAEGDVEIAKALASMRKRLEDSQRKADSIWKGKLKVEGKGAVSSDQNGRPRANSVFLSLIWSYILAIIAWFGSILASLSGRKPKNQ
jgi:tetratricopeptide (TPR) repeat protein